MMMIMLFPLPMEMSLGVVPKRSFDVIYVGDSDTIFLMMWFRYFHRWCDSEVSLCLSLDDSDAVSLFPRRSVFVISIGPRGIYRNVIPSNVIPKAIECDSETIDVMWSPWKDARSRSAVCDSEGGSWFRWRLYYDMVVVPVDFFFSFLVVWLRWNFPMIVALE